jgi:general stress protein 26
MAQQTDRSYAIKKLGDLIKSIEIAMMTTIEADGSLRSRPMATQQVEFDGELWFFASTSSPLAEELRQDERVNLSYAKPDDQRYVSVSGTAAIIDDREKMRELWSPIYKAWFPDGLEDPDLALLKVTVEQAEYWDSPSGVMVAMAGLVKALVTGEPYEGGENRKLELGKA